MEGNLDLERVNQDLDPGLVNLDLDLGNDKLTTRDKPDSALIPKTDVGQKHKSCECGFWREESGRR